MGQSPGVAGLEKAMGLDLLAGIPVLPLEIREKLLPPNSEQGQISALSRPQQPADCDDEAE